MKSVDKRMYWNETYYRFFQVCFEVSLGKKKEMKEYIFLLMLTFKFYLSLSKLHFKPNTLRITLLMLTFKI